MSNRKAKHAEPLRSSKRIKKQPDRAFTVAYKDKDLANLRIGILYPGQGQGKDREKHYSIRKGEGIPDSTLRDPEEIRGGKIFRKYLKPYGWHYEEATGLEATWVFLPPGVNKKTAVEGVTKFAGYKAIAKKVAEDGNDPKIMVRRYIEAAKAAGLPLHEPVETEDVDEDQSLDDDGDVNIESDGDDTVDMNMTTGNRRVALSPVARQQNNNETRQENDPTVANVDPQLQEISEWFETKVPTIPRSDRNKYAVAFVEMGISSTAFLETHFIDMDKELNVLEKMKMPLAHAWLIRSALKK